MGNRLALAMAEHLFLVAATAGRHCPATAMVTETVAAMAVVAMAVAAEP